MRRWLALALLLLLPLAVAAQEQRGFFGRLFGAGEPSVEEQQQDDGTFLERQIERSLSVAGRDVTVRGFSGALSSQATIEEITIADSEGVWLTLRAITLDWNRAALLRRRIVVRELTAGEILVPRLPVTQPAGVAVPSPEARGFSLPQLPVSIEIGRIGADHVVLGTPILGEEATFALAGAMTLADGAGTADISAQRTDGREGSLNLDASFDNASARLVVDLDLSEAAGGIVAHLINLPGRPSLGLTVRGDGPLDDFAAEIALATDGAPRLAGTVSLAGAEGGGYAFGADLGGDISPVVPPAYRDFFGSEVALELGGATLPGGGVRVDTLRLSADAIRLEGQVAVGPGGMPERIALEGRIEGADGTPVLLPLSGPVTQVASVTLDVDFDASVSEDWRLAAAITGLDREGFSAERVALGGTGRIAASPARSVTAAVDFTAEGLNLASSGAQAAVGERVTGRAGLAWTEGQPLVLDALRVEGGTFALDGSGQATFGDALAVSGQATLSAQDLAAFSGLAGRPLAGTAELSLTGSGDPLAGRFDIALDGTTQGLAVGVAQLDPLLAGTGTLTLRTERSETGTRIEDFRIETPQLIATGGGTLATGASDVQVSARIADTSLVAPGLAGPAQLAATARQVPAGWEFDVDAGGSGARVAAAGTVDWLGLEPVVDARFDVTADDLGVFADLAQRPLAGSLTAQGEVRTSLDVARASVTATASGRDLAIGDPRVDPVLAGEVAIAVDAVRSGDVLMIQSLDLASEAARVTASGRIDGLTTAPVFDGDLTVVSSDLSAFSALAGRPVGGAVDVSASGVVAADLSRFDLEVVGTADDLVPGVPGAATALAGRTALSADAAREGDRIEVTRFELANPQITASAEGVVTGLGGRPSFNGRGEVSAPDLAAFSGLAGRPLAGTLDASFNGVVMADLSEVDAVLSARAQGLDLGLPGAPRWPGDTTLDVAARREGDAIRLSQLELLSPGMTVRGGGTVTGLDAAPVLQGELAVRADTIAPFGGLAGRPLGGSIDANVSGTVAADLSTFDVRADGRGQGLRIGQDDADRLLAGTTTLALDASRADGVTTIRQASVDAPGFDARASGTLGESGASLQISARLADIGPYAPDFSGPVTVQGTLVQNGTLALNLDATGPGGIAATIAGTIQPEGPVLDLTVRGQAPLAIANRFVQPRAVAGTADFDLALRGRPGLDAVSGTVRTGGARIVDPVFNVVVENVTATAGFTSGRVDIDAAGSVQAGGSLRVNGSLGLANLDSALDIVLSNVVLQDPQLYHTSISGAVAVNGPLRGGGRIGGDLALGPTEIRVASSTGGGGPIPEITHIAEPADVRETRIRAGLLRQTMDGTESLLERRRNAFALDLGISAPNRIFVRGRGLDAELGGAMRLQGTTVEMVPSGQFDLIRGRLDILGRRLTMSEGSIRLQGNFDPILRLVAETEAEGIDVMVVVEGGIREPDINFLSRPELPQDEVLARLLFGRGINDISALQAAQLASAIATLAGRGPGITERLRENLGVDELDLTTTEDGGTALRVGTYLTEQIYTDVTVGAQGETQLNLNFDVSPSLTVKGGVDNDGNTSLGVFFQRDY